MFKKLFLMSAILGMLTSCEHHEWIDSHKMENDVVICYSEGEKFEVDLRNFNLCEGELCFADSIALDDEVKTANDGFIIERGEILSQRKAGNYTIYRFHYKAAFIVYVCSFAHEVYQRHLPFEFEGEEVWLNGQPVTKQPFVFEKGQTVLTEEEVTEADGDLHSKHSLDFPISVYYRYNGQKLSEFNYLYRVARQNTTSIKEVGKSNISIDVTYDFSPISQGIGLFFVKNIDKIGKWCRMRVYVTIRRANGRENMTSKYMLEHLNELRKKYAPSPRAVMMTGAFLGATFYTTAVQAKADGGKIVISTNARHVSQNSKYYLHMTKPMTLAQVKEKIYDAPIFAHSDGSIKNTLVLDGGDRNIGVICADDDGQVLGAFIDIQAYSEHTGKDMGKILQELGFEPSNRNDIEGYAAVATAIRIGNMNSSNFNVESLQNITEALHRKGYEFKLSEDVEDGSKSLKIFKKDQMIGMMGNYYKSKTLMWLRTDDADLQQMMNKFRANERNDFSKLYQQLQQDSGSQTYQMQPVQKQY